jgi:hypothetical protein
MRTPALKVSLPPMRQVSCAYSDWLRLVTLPELRTPSSQM